MKAATHPGKGLLTPDQQDRFVSEQIDAVFDMVPFGVAGAAITAWIAALLFANSNVINGKEGGGWAVYITLCACAHISLALIRRKASVGYREWRSWANLFTPICLAEGVGWGLLSILVGNSGQLDYEMIAIVLTLAIVAGSVVAFGIYSPAITAFLFPATLPYAVWALLRRDGVHEILAALMLLFIVATFLLARISRQRFQQLIVLRIEKDVQAEAAATANGVLSTFLGMASHELRQPVQALNNWVGVLANIGLPFEAQRPLDVIQQQTIKIDQIFKALLDLSLLDAGKVSPLNRPFPLGPLLRNICNESMAAAESRGLKLVSVGTKAVVLSDAVLVERIVSNLVRNAVRYTESGKIVVGCRLQRATSTVRVQIADTGPGIAPEYQNRIFDAFYQVDAPNARRAEGVGLGLAIVKRIAGLLNVGLRVSSVVGRGTMFELTLPVVAGNSVEAEASEPLVGGLIDGLIVIVDDDSGILESMSALLTQWGYEAVAASSADELLHRLAANPVRPRLIISDYRLRNDENGIDAIERIRSEYNADIPAMLVTGNTAETTLEHARQNGLLLLEKPVSNSQLRAAIINLTMVRPNDPVSAQATSEVT